MNYMYETWRDVIEYEGLYEVSNLGRVRSLCFNGKKRKEPLIIGGGVDRGGYLQVGLWKDRKYRKLYIHRLVCESFILGRKMKKGECVDHINTIRTDNRIENLRVCSHKENCLNPLTRKKNSLAQSKPLILIGVKGGSIYNFNSSVDASRFFNYKNETTIGTYISVARKNNKRTIKLNGEEYYFSTEL